MQARIGVVSSTSAIASLPVAAVNRVYVRAVRAADGLPLVVPILDDADADAVVEELDGILLSGGGDLDPVTYGRSPADPATDLSEVDIERDRWELALVAAADRRRVPVLGICRGLQAMNVAMGGTLVGHLPDVTDQRHRVPGHERGTVHLVDVDQATLLHELVGARIGVNSLHHQAVDRLGAGLRVAARSPDGTVEAIEGLVGRRTLGVQWHPELLTHRPAQRALFSWLVDAARARRAGPASGLAAMPVPVAGVRAAEAAERVA